MTKDLNSSDKGNLAEAWYARVYMEEVAGMKKGVDYDDHTEITVGMLYKAGIYDYPEGFKKTVPDLTYDGVIHDIKSHSGGFTKHDTDQFKMFMKIVTSGKITLDGHSGPLKELKYTLTNPDGAKANVDFIVNNMLSSSLIKVEIFDSSGNKHILEGGRKPKLDGKVVTFSKIVQTIENL